MPHVCAKDEFGLQAQYCYNYFEESVCIEQSYISIALSLLFLLLSIARIWLLSFHTTKVKHSIFLIAKIVSGPSEKIPAFEINIDSPLLSFMGAHNLHSWFSGVTRLGAVVRS